MKIAIVGTHGVGKTTLSFALAKHYKQLGKNVKIIQEVARICPFPINEGMSREAAEWIYHEHSKKELEANKDHEIVIGDRSTCDSFAYAKHFKLNLNIMQVNQAIWHLGTYDKLIFVRPDIPLQPDGIRSIDLEFQKSIDDILSSWLIGYSPIQIKSSQIFDSEDSWKQFCL